LAVVNKEMVSTVTEKDVVGKVTAPKAVELLAVIVLMAIQLEMVQVLVEALLPKMAVSAVVVLLEALPVAM